jgi:hypothetical protein
MNLFAKRPRIVLDKGHYQALRRRPGKTRRGEVPAGATEQCGHSVRRRVPRLVKGPGNSSNRWMTSQRVRRLMRRLLDASNDPFRVPHDGAVTPRRLIVS